MKGTKKIIIASGVFLAICAGAGTYLWVMAPTIETVEATILEVDIMKRPATGSQGAEAETLAVGYAKLFYRGEWVIWPFEQRLPPGTAAAPSVGNVVIGNRIRAFYDSNQPGRLWMTDPRCGWPLIGRYVDCR